MNRMTYLCIMELIFPANNLDQFQPLSQLTYLVLLNKNIANQHDTDQDKAITDD